jgi:hypothetical protein
MSKLFDKICYILYRNKRTLLLLAVFMYVVFYADCSFAEDDDEKYQNCISDKIEESQTQTGTGTDADTGDGCWSCDIILQMMKATMLVTLAIYDPIQELCEVIIQFGGAIWLALYFLKALGSFAAQDPGKIMDGAMVFMFKWALVYGLIMAGISEIVGYIVNPILSIGFDIGTEFSNAVSGISLPVQSISSGT